MFRFVVLVLAFFCVLQIDALRPSQDPTHPFYEHGVHADFFNDLAVAAADIGRLAAHGPKRVVANHRRFLQNIQT
jgi:hypothetical protein